MDEAGVDLIVPVYSPHVERRLLFKGPDVEMFLAQSFGAAICGLSKTAFQGATFFFSKGPDLLMFLAQSFEMAICSLSKHTNRPTSRSGRGVTHSFESSFPDLVLRSAISCLCSLSLMFSGVCSLSRLSSVGCCKSLKFSLH